MSNPFNSDLDGALNKLHTSMVDAAKAFPGEFQELPDAPTAESDYGPYIQNLLDEAFKPWKETPAESDLEAAADSVGTAITSFGSSPPTEDDVRDSTAAEKIVNPSSIIPGYAEEVTESIQGWQGATIRSFKKNYVSRFNFIIGIQHSLGIVLQETMKAEHTVWKNAHKDVIELIDGAVYAFDELDCYGGDGTATTLSVVSGVAGIIGAAANPPLAIALATVAMGASMAASAATGDDAKPPLDASRYADLWYQVVDALKTLEADVGNAESSITSVVTQVYAALDSKIKVGTDEDGDNVNVDAMDLLMPPPPKYVEKIADAAKTESKEDDEALKDGITDTVNKPSEHYEPDEYQDK